MCWNLSKVADFTRKARSKYASARRSSKTVTFAIFVAFSVRILTKSSEQRPAAGVGTESCNCLGSAEESTKIGPNALLSLLMSVKDRLPYDMDFGRQRREGGATAIGRAFLEHFASEVQTRTQANGTCLEFSPVYLAQSFLRKSCETTWELTYQSEMCDEEGKYRGQYGYCTDIHELHRVAPAGQFDLIICTQVFEHLARPWIAVQQLSRVLRPGGILMFSAPHTSIYHAHFDDYYRFTVAGARYLLEEIGSLCVLYEAGGNSIPYTVLSLLGYSMDDVDVHDMLATADPIAPLNIYSIAKKTATNGECEKIAGKVKYTKECMEAYRHGRLPDLGLKCDQQNFPEFSR